MRRTYLVTVDVLTMAEKYKNGGRDAIVYALSRAPFIANPEVILAPETFQPINNTEGTKQE